MATPKGVEFDSKGRGKLPEERFDGAEQVRQLANSMIKYDQSYRAPSRAKVDGLFAGNPTYSLARLKAKKMAWMPRVNFRESEADLGALSTPMYDLVTEVDHCVEVTLDNDLLGITSGEVDAYTEGIQKHFTWLNFVRNRSDFNFDTLVPQREMLLHGLGYRVRLNENWMGRSPISGRILFPENCPLNFKRDGKYFLLREFVPGEDVYGYIRNEEAARTRGWYPDNVWEALATASKRSKPQRNDIQEIQRCFRNGDIGYSNEKQVGLWLDHIIVAEYDGGFSHYIVEENIETNRDKTGNGYLYRQRHKFDEWPLVIYNFDIGDGGLIYSVRGLGLRSKDFYELSNRLKNAMAAQVLISAFPMVKQVAGGDADQDKLRLWRMAALSIIPKGLELTTLQMPPLGNGPIAFDKLLRETLERNNKSSTPTTPEPKDRETAFSFSMRAHDSARISNGMQSLYESNLQQDYEMQLRMVLKTPKGSQSYQKMAEEFRQRCLREPGTSKDVWEKIFNQKEAIDEIREVTSTGAGSAATRLQALLALMQYIYPATDEARKVTIERDLVSTLMGGSKVDRYARNIRDVELPDSDDSLATVESDALSLGGDAVKSSKQNHVKHAQNHLGKATQVVHAIQNGDMSPEQGLIAIRKLGEHAAQHLSELQNNPRRKQEFDQLHEEWQALAQIAKKLESQIQQRQSQTPPAQRASEDAQIKDKVATADIARKDRKSNADIVRRARNDSFKMRMTAATHAAKAATNGSRQPANA